jgi:hypothetical protein
VERLVCGGDEWATKDLPSNFPEKKKKKKKKGIRDGKMRWGGREGKSALLSKGSLTGMLSKEVI